MAGCESTCKGTCCAVFFLPLTYEEFGETADRRLEGAKIYDMLIPLTNAEAAERWRRFGSPVVENNPPKPKEEGHFFTCRHWDEDTLLCTIYPTRPLMCKGYPYGRPCEHGCDEEGAPMEELIPIRVKVKGESNE